MLRLRLSIAPRPRVKVVSLYERAKRLYQDCDKVTVDVPLGDICFKVPMAFATLAEISSINPDDYCAFVIGGMFFLTDEIPERYRAMIAFHECAEHAAHRGFNLLSFDAPEYKQGHFQAVTLECAYADRTLEAAGYWEFMRWREECERSEYFEKHRDDSAIGHVAEGLEGHMRAMASFLTYRRRTLVETTIP